MRKPLLITIKYFESFRVLNDKTEADQTQNSLYVMNPQVKSGILLHGETEV